MCKEIQKVWIDAEEGSDTKIKVVFENGIPLVKEVGKASEVEAKFHALIEALRMLEEGEDGIRTIIYTDDRYIIGHMMKDWTMGKKNLSHKVLKTQAKSLMKKAGNCVIEFMPKSKLRKYTCF